MTAMKNYAPLQPQKVDSCVTEAIIKKVQQKDLIDWAQKEIVQEQPKPIIMPPQPSRPLMRHLIRQWLP